MRFNLSNTFFKHGKIQKLQWFWLTRFAVCQVTFEPVFIFEKLLYCQKSLQEVLLFHWFFKKLNLQNTRNFCESQNFSAKYAVLHRKLQYLKEKWCSSQKIILQNISSQTWLQPSRDKKNHPGTEKPGKNFEMELSRSPKLYFVKVTAEQVTKPFSSRNYWLVPCFCIF